MKHIVDGISTVAGDILPTSIYLARDEAARRTIWSRNLGGAILEHLSRRIGYTFRITRGTRLLYSFSSRGIDKEEEEAVKWLSSQERYTISWCSETIAGH